MGEEPKERICSMLKSLEEFIAENRDKVLAGEEGLFHVRRAMELMRCSPEKPVIDERKLLVEKGVVVE
jgi:hypothetical protein